MAYSKCVLMVDIRYLGAFLYKYTIQIRIIFLTCYACLPTQKGLATVKRVVSMLRISLTSITKSILSNVLYFCRYC